MTKPPDIEREWHLDKRVPIALIITLMAQTAGIVWWASALSSRVGVLEKSDESSVSQNSQLNTQLTSIAVDISALKEKAQATNDDVSDIKRSVEMLTTQVLQEKRR